MLNTSKHILSFAKEQRYNDYLLEALSVYRSAHIGAKLAEFTSPDHEFEFGATLPIQPEFPFQANFKIDADSLII